ncbi:MAG TPA: response regulator transcription factor [Campylobacterales bacterium]|nr:response regulator transcription factor [Campylobacterales bacterium]
MNYQAFAKKMNAYTVLYVEDDPHVRQHISEFLNRYCKKVYACDSSEEGLEIYKEHKPQILLLDINLPKMNGIEFATLIRKQDKKTRILISTAYTNQEFMVQAIELELTRYLVKPVTNEDFFMAFTKCIKEIEGADTVYLGEGYKYNKKTTSIIKDNKSTILRKKESEILEFFIQREGEVVRYDMLEDAIWSNGPMTRDAIRSQIRNIRQKICSKCFQNITGVGYRFEVIS